MDPRSNPGILKLGIFGGAFDPPHKTHAALIELAVQQLQLDEIRVLPTGNAWHRSHQPEAAVHRLAMAELAFCGLDKVVVDARETRRVGPTYTVDTLRELKTENPSAELFLIIGEDQARAFTTWHEWQVIANSAIICVAGRACLAGAGAIFSPPKSFETRFLTLSLPSSPISATEIRQRIARHENVAPLVGEGVARYIAAHHLYQTPLRTT